MFGDGPTNSIILQTSTTANGINVGSDEELVQYVTLRDFCLRGPGTNSTATGIQIGLRPNIHDLEQAFVEKMVVRNWRIGVCVSNSTPVTISQCRITANEDCAILGAPDGVVSVIECETGYNMNPSSDPYDSYGWSSPGAQTNMWCMKFFSSPIRNTFIYVQSGEHRAGRGWIYASGLNCITVVGGNTEAGVGPHLVILTNCYSGTFVGCKMLPGPGGTDAIGLFGSAPRRFSFLDIFSPWVSRIVDVRAPTFGKFPFVTGDGVVAHRDSYDDPTPDEQVNGPCIDQLYQPLAASTNGFVSFSKNKAALNPIVPTGSPFNFTNTTTTNNINMFISGGTVSQIALNGTTIASELSGIATIPLQPGEWVTVTYGSTPTMHWKPF